MSKADKLKEESKITPKKAPNDKNRNFFYDIRIASSSISGAIDMLEIIDDENKRRHYLGVLKSGFMRMKRILNNAETVVNLQSGSDSLNPEYFNIHDLVKSVVSDANRRWASNYVNIEEKCSRDLWFYGDYVMLKRMIVNLICNSVKYTKKQTACSIFVSAKNSRGDVVIKVKDNGFGIPEDRVDKILCRMDTDPNEYYSKVGRGSGLGLAFVKEIVELYNGEIDITCPKKGGTEIIIRLPRTKKPDNITTSVTRFSEAMEWEYYDVMMRRVEK